MVFPKVSRSPAPDRSMLHGLRKMSAKDCLFFIGMYETAVAFLASVLVEIPGAKLSFSVLVLQDAHGKISCLHRNKTADPWSVVWFVRFKTSCSKGLLEGLSFPEAFFNSIGLVTIGNASASSPDVLTG